jgi:hypothetical protein
MNLANPLKLFGSELPDGLVIHHDATPPSAS